MAINTNTNAISISINLFFSCISPLYRYSSCLLWWYRSGPSFNYSFELVSWYSLGLLLFCCMFGSFFSFYSTVLAFVSFLVTYLFPFSCSAFVLLHFNLNHFTFAFLTHAQPFLTEFPLQFSLNSHFPKIFMYFPNFYWLKHALAYSFFFF